jgi:hypothetical protein
MQPGYYGAPAGYPQQPQVYAPGAHPQMGQFDYYGNPIPQYGGVAPYMD